MTVRQRLTNVAIAGFVTGAIVLRVGLAVAQPPAAPRPATTSETELGVCEMSRKQLQVSLSQIIDAQNQEITKLRAEIEKSKAEAAKPHPPAEKAK